MATPTTSRTESAEPALREGRPARLKPRSSQKRMVVMGTCRPAKTRVTTVGTYSGDGRPVVKMSKKDWIRYAIRTMSSST